MSETSETDVKIRRWRPPTARPHRSSSVLTSNLLAKVAMGIYFGMPAIRKARASLSMSCDRRNRTGLLDREIRWVGSRCIAIADRTPVSYS